VKIECYNQVDKIPVDKEHVMKTISALSNSEDPHQQGELRIVFVDDPFIQQLNKQYLKHDYATDVLSFPLERENSLLEGEIYVSIDRAISQAEMYQITVQEETWRLIIHGVLHLFGYDDQTDEQRRMMRQKEDYYLTSYGLTRKER
jgi:probable rRNA maturation factor